MKEIIGTEYPYKDQRGQWIIFIQKQEDVIIVTHIKKEVSWESSALFDQQHFQFSWSLMFELSADGSILNNVTVKIETMDFEETVTPETRKEILDVFNSTEFIEPIDL